MGFITHRGRWAPLAVSLALLLGLGVLGLSLLRSSTEAAEAALGDGAMDRQRTVAALTDQYLQLAAKEAFDSIASEPLELSPRSTADARILQGLLDKRGGFFDHGALLADLTGEPLTVLGDVPPGDDPGYAPLRRALVRQDPGVSSLMWVGDIPVVGIGVPVLREGSPAAVLIAYFRADTSMLQRYSEKLGEGTGGVGMVVDGTGTVVAARHADLVGTSLAGSPALARADVAGHDVVRRDGTEIVVTWAPVATGGWMLVEEQATDEFYASVHDQSGTAQLALLVVLVVAAVLAALLNHRTDRARRRGARRAEALVRDAHDAITIVDPHGTVTYASPAFERVLGFDPGDVVGRQAIELVHPDDRARTNAAVLAASGHADDRQRIQARVLRRDGTPCHCELVISDQSADRSIGGTIVSMRDITEVVALHDRLSHQALHDPLTELPNRTQLERRLADALGANRGAPHVAVLFIDLDGFKAVNDQVGHDGGDELLIQVAGRLRTCLRDEDVVARLGGDEFVVVLRGSHSGVDAPTIATRVLDSLAEPFLVSGHTVRVGASIGVSLAGPDSTPDSMVREADAAMYLAKDRGRFRYEFPAANLAGTGTRTRPTP